jgi:hypothetical protein
MAFDIDKAPSGSEERAKLMGIVSTQTKEAIAAWYVKVTCPCGKTLSLMLAIKCLTCKVFFCPGCAKRHFESVES